MPMPGNPRFVVPLALSIIIPLGRELTTRVGGFQ
jgi:hypothetical protein